MTRQHRTPSRLAARGPNRYDASGRMDRRPEPHFAEEKFKQ